jgi:hypothetical protein
MKAAAEPQFTLTLTPATVARLQRVVARHNGEHGAALTLGEWLALHVRELAVQEELVEEQQRLVRQAERDVAAALLAAKERLLGE